MSEKQTANNVFKAMRASGANLREASVAAFPELPSDNAVKTSVLMFDAPKQVDARFMRPGDVSRALSVPGRRDTLVSAGLEQAIAHDLAESTFSVVPESDYAVDYDRMDKLLLGIQQDFAAGATEQALASRETASTFESIGVVMEGLFTGFQQATFSVAAGESWRNAAERMWPSADIREDDGTVIRKSVFMQAAKSSALLALGLMAPVLQTPISGSALTAAAAKEAKRLAESDFRDNLLYGNEVIEYWMAGNSLIGTTLPDKDSPEREQYDQKVRNEAAQYYAELMDKKFGKLALAGISLGGAIGDVFVDPAVFISEAPVAAVKGLRALGHISSRARLAGAVADRSRRIDDISVALGKAQQWVDDVSVRYQRNPGKHKAEYDHARDFWVRQKNRFDAAKTEGLPEAIALSTSPRIRPEHIRELGEVYLANPRKTRSALTVKYARKQANTARKEVARLEKRLQRAKSKADDVSPEQLGDDVDALQQQLNAAREEHRSWAETQQFMENRANNPASRTAAFFKGKMSRSRPYISDHLPIPVGAKRKIILRKIQENIDRGVAQGAPEEELLQWERAYQQVLDNEVTPFETVARSRQSAEQIIVSSLDDNRRYILSEQKGLPVDLDTAESIEQVKIRVAYGPDNTERVMEAADILARGGEIDDVAYHGMPVDMYNTSRGLRPRAHSSTEGRAVSVVSEKELASEVEWLGKDPVNTTVEAAKWQQTVGEKFSDMWQRGLHPGSWNLRAAGALQDMREPMRVFQSVSPRTYQRVHNAMRSQEFEVMRMNEVFKRELTHLGVYKNVKGNLGVDPDASAKFYRIMNLDPTSNSYQQALRGVSELERRSLRRVRQELDFIADKLGIQNSDKYIEGYIDHVMDMRWFDDGAMPPEFKGLAADAKVFNPHLLRRRGGEAEFIEDISLALDTYARAASRKLHMEPLFDDLKQMTDLHIKQNPGDEWFVVYVNDFINSMKGKQSNLGQRIDMKLQSLNARLRSYEDVQDIARATGGAAEKMGRAVHAVGMGTAQIPGGRKVGAAVANEGIRLTEFGSNMSLHGLPRYEMGSVGRTALGVTSLAYSSVLGGSGRYFPMAVSTALATTASRKGIFNTLRGIMVMGSKQGRLIAKQVGLDRQWLSIMEDAAWTKMGKLAANMPSFNGITVFGPSITATENLIRGWTFHATLGDLIRKNGFSDWGDVTRAGMAHSFLDEGLRTTEEVNHVFGQLGKPPIFNRTSKSGSAAATQFLSFIPKQSEELLAQVMENPGRIGQYLMISGYLGRTAAKAGLDISDYIGFGYLPKSPDEATSIAFETVSSLLDVTHEGAQIASGRGDPTRMYQKGKMLARNLVNFIPLAMATQRFTRGAEQLRLGKVYSSGELRRELDLGEFEWDPAKSPSENISNLPRAFLSEQGPNVPTEFFSLLTGLNSVQSKLERQHFNDKLNVAKERAFRLRLLADAMDDFVQTGDSRAFDKAFNKAIEEGIFPSSMRTVLRRSLLEQSMSRLMRLNAESQEGMINGVESELKARMRYELLYGTER